MVIRYYYLLALNSCIKSLFCNTLQTPLHKFGAVTSAIPIARFTLVHQRTNDDRLCKEMVRRLNVINDYDYVRDDVRMKGT